MSQADLANEEKCLHMPSDIADTFFTFWKIVLNFCQLILWFCSNFDDRSKLYLDLNAEIQFLKGL